ncbi:MAG TPA: YezD family protein [Candidatus Binataceae bacterium]|nr:YezD family protein [Candidatus Binataceae bacterium]
MKPELLLKSQIGDLPQADSCQQTMRAIANAIKGVRFGSVEIVIQDSRVIQIERKEKFRFDKGERR